MVERRDSIFFFSSLWLCCLYLVRSHGISLRSWRSHELFLADWCYEILCVHKRDSNLYKISVLYLVRSHGDLMRSQWNVLLAELMRSFSTKDILGVSFFIIFCVFCSSRVSSVLVVAGASVAYRTVPHDDTQLNHVLLLLSIWRGRLYFYFLATHVYFSSTCTRDGDLCNKKQ